MGEASRLTWAPETPRLTWALETIHRFTINESERRSDCVSRGTSKPVNEMNPRECEWVNKKETEQRGQTDGGAEIQADRWDT